ncbi:MAG: C4-dicarboxylate ABC transporter [Rubrivivax sp.]|nr:MAG: C4-dicarboxylate ABC transporter [Rubrivivax sp.]
MQTPPASSARPSTSALEPRPATSVRDLPVSLFGAVMGLSGLALAWRLARASLGAPLWIGEAIGAFAVGVFMLLSLGYLAKLARHPAAVHAEFQHPVSGNFFGTVVIAVLLVAAVVEPYSLAAASVIWTVGVLATLALAVVSTSRLLKGSVDATHALPASLMPGVATLDIPLTGRSMPMAWAPEVNLMAGGVGALLAVLLYVLIINRLVHRDPLAPAMTPSLMILMAPFAVGFLAYTNLVGGVDRFAALLFYFALFMFVVIVPKVFRRGARFSLAWWVIGFPLAALVNAALRYAQFRDSAPLWALAVALLALLSVALAVLTVQTLRLALRGPLFG